jgi:hypothetical protein
MTPADVRLQVFGNLQFQAAVNQPERIGDEQFEPRADEMLLSSECSAASRLPLT